MKKKKKYLIDKELDLYHREKELALKEDIFAQRQINWEMVIKARVDTYEMQKDLGISTAKLEAKKESLALILSIQEESYILMVQNKDKENDYLKGLVQKTIEALQNANIVNNVSRVN
jgi:hypothetical protein